MFYGESLAGQKPAAVMRKVRANLRSLPVGQVARKDEDAESPKAEAIQRPQIDTSIVGAMQDAGETLSEAGRDPELTSLTRVSYIFYGHPDFRLQLSEDF
jgi:hypothetical protein